jgi:hypothetical protein
MAEVVAAAGFRCQLVLAQALIDHLAQKVVAGPGEIFDFGDELGAPPLHAAQDQRRFEAAAARRRRLFWAAVMPLAHSVNFTPLRSETVPAFNRSRGVLESQN